MIGKPFLDILAIYRAGGGRREEALDWFLRTLVEGPGRLGMTELAELQRLPSLTVGGFDPHLYERCFEVARRAQMELQRRADLPLRPDPETLARVVAEARPDHPRGPEEEATQRARLDWLALQDFSEVTTPALIDLARLPKGPSAVYEVVVRARRELRQRHQRPPARPDWFEEFSFTSPAVRVSERGLYLDEGAFYPPEEIVSVELRQSKGRRRLEAVQASLARFVRVLGSASGLALLAMLAVAGVFLLADTLVEHGATILLVALGAGVLGSWGLPLLLRSFCPPPVVIIHTRDGAEHAIPFDNTARARDCVEAIESVRAEATWPVAQA